MERISDAEFVCYLKSVGDMAAVRWIKGRSRMASVVDLFYQQELHYWKLQKLLTVVLQKESTKLKLTLTAAPVMIVYQLQCKHCSTDYIIGKTI